MRMLVIRLGTGSRILVYPKLDHVPATYTVLNIPSRTWRRRSIT